MALARPCLRCGRLTAGSYCPEHQPRRPRGRQLAKLRARAFATYGRRCRDCGRSDMPLEIHHVNSDPSDNRIRNLVPLCRDCHRSATFPGVSPNPSR
jgi:5-methylcytosine-specific restriction endonuclease McrA